MSESEQSVLFVSPWEMESGSATYAHYLLDELSSIQDVDLLQWDHESLFKRGSGIAVLNFDFINRVCRHDIVHVQYHFGRYLMSLPIILLICLLTRTKVVLAQHERFGDLPFPRLVYWYHQIIHFAVDRIVVHTEARKKLVWRPHQKRTVVVPHGVFYRPDFERSPSEANRLLIPGLIRPNKGHEIAVRALEDLPDCVELRIVGKPSESELFDGEEYVNHLKDVADTLGVQDQLVLRTKFLPEKELYDEFRQADFVVMPYDHDAPMSGILAHAISWKCITIMSEAPVFKSAVPIKDLFFSPRTPEMLKEKILDLRTDLDRQSEIIREMDELSNEYSWESAAGQFQDVYRTM